MKDDKKALKAKIKRQKADRMRALRVVKYLEYPFILGNSPVEIDEGYIVSDMESYDVFASFIFKNISERPIRKLNIQLACYLNQNIPYTHIDFTYAQDDLTFGIISKDGIDLKLREANTRAFVEKNETFGACVYIPLPESYFTKLEVILVSVEYAGGSVEEINTVVTGNNKKYSDLDNISKMVYSRVNIYRAAEERFPTKVLPQFGEKVWLCCCGNKNPVAEENCEKCGREKQWQEKAVVSSALEETKNRMINDPTEITLHDKSKFKQNKFLETQDDVDKKIEQYEKAMKNIAYEEKRKHKRQMMLIPKILIGAGIIYLLVLGLKILEMFQITDEAASAAGKAIIKLFSII